MQLSHALYPATLVVAGRRCVVFGGGPVAARKVRGLHDAGADVVVVSPWVCEEIEQLGVEVVLRPYARGDLADAWLAIAATDDPAVNSAVHAEGDSRRVWVNSADQTDACSFILPAVAREGPVAVAVSTSGHSPALATWIRDRISAQLGPEVGTLAELLAEAREELKATGRSTESVDWRRALDSDMLELIKEGRTAQARERLQACLSSS